LYTFQKALVRYYLGAFVKNFGIAIIVWLAFTGAIFNLAWFSSILMADEYERGDPMSDINLVEITGRLGSDPNEHHTDNGLVIAGMSIATNRRWKDKRTGEWQKRTDWHQVSAFGESAEWCIQELKKGSTVRVLGRLQTDIVEDKYGQRRYYTKVIAQKIGLE